MLRLYDNPFSPFARKVRLVLEHKGLEFEAVDGLRISARAQLARVNPRIEVPALDHDGLLVVNSADIVAYLERMFPQKPVYPADAGQWVRARAWERCSDSVVDPILVDISYWTWAQRKDRMPAGLREAAQRDLDVVYAALERDLAGRDFLCGSLSIADLALFPHIIAAKPLNVAFDPQRFPALGAWLRRLRALDICRADIERTKSYLQATAASPDFERHKIFWRGDRIEWIMARGFHEWFVTEIRDGRVLWPGLGVPTATGRGALE